MTSALAQSVHLITPIFSNLPSLFFSFPLRPNATCTDGAAFTFSCMWCLPGKHPSPSYMLFGICDPLVTLCTRTCWLFLTNPISSDALEPSNDVLLSLITTTNAMLYEISLYFTLARHYNSS